MNSNKKYKVALINNIIAPYNVPLFEGLSQHPSLDLHVFYCARSIKLRKWDVLDRQTYQYKVLAGKTLIYNEWAYHINPSIVYHLAKGSYDAVILVGTVDFTMQAAFITAKLTKTRTILFSEGIASPQNALGIIMRPLRDFIIRHVAAIIVPGTASRNYHVKVSSAPEKIFIAPNIVDTDVFFEKSSAYKKRKALFKHDLHLGKNTIVLFVGQLIRRKGVEFLIQAFSKLRHEREDVALVIIGDGELKSELNQLVSSENTEDIIFTGWISEEEKIKYYGIADLFVLPTLQDLCPLVLNEAMCCSLPIVTTTAAGCAVDMVNHDNGFIVPPADSSALYEAIKTIIDDEELQRKMGKKSYEIVTSQFNLSTAVNGFVNAVEYVCGT